MGVKGVYGGFMVLPPHFGQFALEGPETED